VTIFGEYSRYYDLLYQDRDYRGEVRLIQRTLQRHRPNARTILELGCGTGRHAALLAVEGYTIHGVDRSHEMLRRAREHRRTLAPPLETALRLSLGDSRTVRLAERFDVVLAAFHVVSYQTATADLLATFATARAHLEPGGVFLFDCWYGPAVPTERPTRRVK